MADTLTDERHVDNAPVQHRAFFHAYEGFITQVFPIALANFVIALHSKFGGRSEDLSELDSDELADISAQCFCTAVRNQAGRQSPPDPLAWAREKYEQIQNDDEAVELDRSDMQERVIRNRLLLALKKRRMTQADLARVLRKSEAQVSRFLANPERSKLGTLIEYSEAIGVDLSDVVRDLGGAPGLECCDDKI